ncbi:TetR/AcrR family transcriptional regulator [Brevibacterium sp. CFH 10365]|uniref:TetR/AcrR family transcriptional regulator n=1 Tax=Brevibacterium sp. CFH 10365 TaxID=2585207 RepID=UPI0012663442|nr:TetR/AcrR family transcriptional regulator [Brevibacterium sp. CFH 10365]
MKRSRVATQRDIDKLQTQQRIVDSALELFETAGYETTSMVQIARHAETSRANLYLHFTSKSQIVLHRMRQLESEVLGLYSGLDGVETTVDGVMTWLETAAQLWKTHRAEFDAISRAMTVDSAVFDEWLELHRRITRSRSATHAGPRTGDDRDQWEAHLITLMIGLEHNFYFLYVRGQSISEKLILRSLAEQWSAFLD